MAGVRAHHWDFGNMPHIAGITQDSLERIGEVAVSEMIRLLDGERPHHLCNPGIFA